jgi:hypothetical protein
MLPDDYVLVAIDTASIVAETILEFPDDPRAVGDAWIESRRSTLLGVPSWIRTRITQCPDQPGSPGRSFDPTRPRPAVRFD